MEQLIIHTVTINRTGELKHFEIPLSNNAKRITGLWYKIRLLDNAVEGDVITGFKGSTPYRSELIIAYLSLSSNKKEGVFYFGTVVLDNANYRMLDYTDDVFEVNNYSHASSGNGIELSVDAETSNVHGAILDRWGVINGKHVKYEIDIYLFQELNEKENKNDTRTSTGICQAKND